MRKIANMLMLLVIVLIFTACGNSIDSEQNTEVSVSESVSSGTMQDNSEDDRAGKNDAAKKSEQEENMGTKTLVVYFSCTGTTKTLAEYAADILEADLYEIVPEKPYTEKDLAYYTGGRADKEQDDPQARPAISGSISDIAGYDKILLGYPIWHGQAPRIISTFLESYDFSGKTIAPFCTSHSSGIGSSADNLHSLCTDATKWTDGKRFGSETSKETMKKWLEDIGF